MSNVVLCFDQARQQPGLAEASNAERLIRLLHEADGQLVWYHPGGRRPWRASGWGRRTTDARAAVAQAYSFLVDSWRPGDRIYLFGAGRGAYCAGALAHLLGTVGVLPALLDYVLDAYAVPRTPRTPQDWRRVARLAARLSGRTENSVPVTFLGLWDATVGVGPARMSRPGILPNVASGRHAVAIDGSPGALLLDSVRVEQVWFRGAHCDVAGGRGACAPLADISLDWMLDGAVNAGLAMRTGDRQTTVSGLDALAGSARTISVRKLPADAMLHSSVDIYLREHPEYWRRLPRRVYWADPDWAARGERLVPAAPAAVAHGELAAAAS